MNALAVPRAPSVGRVGAGPAGLALREQARRRVVRLVMVVYLLAIFEGSLRKWVVPEFSQYVFFIRDPFLLAAYAVATLHGLWPQRSAWFQAMLWIVGAGVVIAALQTALGGPSDTRLILAAHGFRSYFLYIPLAFLVGAQFRREDLLRFYRWTLVLAVPIAVLVTLQFFSPLNSPINVGIASDEALQFRGLNTTGERTRPMGTFSSGAGQQQFVGTAWAIALGLFVATARVRRMSMPLLAVCTVAVLVCIGLSGSRGTVVQCGLSVLFALGLSVVGRGGAQKSRALLWSIGLAGAALVLYPILLPEGFAAFTERWTAAQAAESRTFEGGIAGRALYSMVDFVRLFEQVPLLGYGLGYGTNASITLKATVDGVMPGLLAEADFSRHIVDLGPVFGMAYIALRLALVVGLMAIALRVTRQVADPMPMLLLSYAATTIATGQITGQGAVNVYGWLFVGLLLAACREARAAVPRRRRTAIDTRSRHNSRSTA